MNQHILIVEDEIVTRSQLVSYFENEGYQVSQADNGLKMKEILANQTIDLILLDVNLPGEDGMMLTREIRGHSEVGIILVTGRTDKIDRIVGLEMGADDYVTKPFQIRELQVRVKNLIWRMSLAKKGRHPLAFSQENKGVFRFDNWVLDTNRRSLTQDDVPVKLTKAEFELMVSFSSNPNVVLCRERLLNMLSHRVDAPNDRIIDVLVRRIRSKIEPDPKNPQMIMTVHGEGYMFAGNIYAA
ncbi:two-component system response regulator TorR [Photobacterium galatheae]|uniref:two-component system response regulator TorR n=1 Tax=Photobacterium galatheae TaxID=1654360 RepID=UPI00202CFA8E|nr:two-component system response regulator TorR [Photobacterium galatheae]MCM0148832.1 two-component system response regulator TorR [Photobacterium galatheae]